MTEASHYNGTTNDVVKLSKVTEQEPIKSELDEIIDDVPDIIAAVERKVSAYNCDLDVDSITDKVKDNIAAATAAAAAHTSPELEKMFQDKHIEMPAFVAEGKKLLVAQILVRLVADGRIMKSTRDGYYHRNTATEAYNPKSSDIMSDDLKQITERIKGALLRARRSLHEYRRAGIELLQAKALAGEGNWYDYLAKHVGISPRHALRLTDLAKGWETLQPYLKQNPDITVVEAVAFINRDPNKPDPVAAVDRREDRDADTINSEPVPETATKKRAAKPKPDTTFEERCEAGEKKMAQSDWRLVKDRVLLLAARLSKETLRYFAAQIRNNEPIQDLETWFRRLELTYSPILDAMQTVLADFRTKVRQACEDNADDHAMSALEKETFDKIDTALAELGGLTDEQERFKQSLFQGALRDFTAEPEAPLPRSEDEVPATVGEDEDYEEPGYGDDDDDSAS
jgi:hypothetical protein